MPELTASCSFAPFFAIFYDCFTKPTYQSFVHLMMGWILCLGRRTVTGLIRAANAEGVKHHTSYHRFFRTAKWRLDDLSCCLLPYVLKLVPAGLPIRAIVDDTLGRHVGGKIHSAAVYQDAVRSTRKHTAFHWGHVWVVLAIEITIPLINRSFALPLFFRLYRSKELCKEQGRPFRTRSQLAKEMVNFLAILVDGRQILLIGDNAYTNKYLVRDRPENVHLLGHARLNAALYGAPDTTRKKPGRKPIKGERLPSPEERAKETEDWVSLTIKAYGKMVTIEFKIFDAIWYRVSHGEFMRFVLVRGWPKRDETFLLCTTDLSLSPTAMIQHYCKRWLIEVTFKQTKQLLGFEDPQNRTELAVKRTAPMALLLYTMVVLWFCSLDKAIQLESVSSYAWYQKETPVFSDMLAALRREIWRSDILDPLGLSVEDQNIFRPLLHEAAYAA